MTPISSLRQLGRRRHLLAVLIAAPTIMTALGLSALDVWRFHRPTSPLFVTPVADSLADAIASDDVQRAYEFIRAGQDPNNLIAARHPGLTGGRWVQVSPLLWAVATQSRQTMLMLLGFGARIDAPAERRAVCLAEQLWARRHRPRARIPRRTLISRTVSESRGERSGPPRSACRTRVRRLGRRDVSTTFGVPLEMCGHGDVRLVARALPLRCELCGAARAARRLYHDDWSAGTSALMLARTIIGTAAGLRGHLRPIHLALIVLVCVHAIFRLPAWFGRFESGSSRTPIPTGRPTNSTEPIHSIRPTVCGLDSERHAPSRSRQTSGLTRFSRSSKTSLSRPPTPGGFESSTTPPAKVFARSFSAVWTDGLADATPPG